MQRRDAENPSMDDNFLEISSCSLLVFEPRKYSNIIIGVPHHAPAGVAKLPCPEHREADENAGFIGRYIAEALQSASVVACNYPIDVNKSLVTDYSSILAFLKPKYLIEIHGHGNRSANFNVEISSGKKERTISETFAHAILEESRLIKTRFLLKCKIAGDNELGDRVMQVPVWTSEVGYIRYYR